MVIMSKQRLNKINVSRETKISTYIVITALTIAAITAFLKINVVYDVYIGEKYISSVSDQCVFESANDAAMNEIACKVPDIMTANSAYTKKNYLGFIKTTDSVYDLSQKMFEQYGKEITGAYSVYVDGEYVATGINKKQLIGSIDKTEKMYAKINDLLGGDKCEGIAGKIEIIPCNTEISNISGEKELLEIFGYNSLEKQYEELTTEHFSEVETFSPSLSLSKQVRKNADVLKDIDIADKIITQTVFSYEKSHTESITEKIPYEVEKIYTTELEMGTVALKCKGEPGEKKTDYTVYTQDGVETGRRKMRETELSKPVNCVMLVGTYEKSVGDGFPKEFGKFMLPCKGIKTSGYGTRTLFGETSLHKGCDIAAPDGTEIICAAEGKVLYAGENGNGYGIHVVVEHTDGYSTLYAHMRKACVSTGDEVLIGQKLGEVGLTGMTTGYHLHFEILKDGVAIDPEEYILVK